MSKNFRRSAVALVLAATMVFGSQGFTAFADNGDNSGMPELLSVQTNGEEDEEELTIGQSGNSGSGNKQLSLKDADKITPFSLIGTGVVASK